MAERGVALVFAGAALAWSLSCAQIIGLEPYGAGGAGGASQAGSRGASTGDVGGGPAGGSASASATATTGAGGAKPCDGTCKEAPDSWNGPVRIEPGTTCSKGSLTGTLTLPLRDATCSGCDCVPEECAIKILYYDANDKSCASSDGADVAIAGCGGAGGASGTNVEVKIASGSPQCAPNATCTPPSTDPIALCNPGACERGGACFAPGDVICIYAPGSPGCPEDYTPYQGGVGYGTYHADGCSCGAVTGPVDCSAASVDFYPGPACGGGGENVTIDKCTELSITPGSVKYHPASAGSCAKPTATVTSGSPFALCCKPAPV